MDTMIAPKILHADKFINADGESVNRLVLDVDGHNVQVIQYDDGPNVVVYVDTAVTIIDIDEAGSLIAELIQ